MTHATTPPPPPVLDDPMLEALTFDQLTQLVAEVGPDAFYVRAAAFDQAAGRLQDVLDQIRRQLNIVRESWTGKVSDEFDALAREISGRMDVVLQFLQNPGYGSVLRKAGDLLAVHQRRLRDLQGQKAQQESTPPAAGGPPPELVAQVNNQAAKQILRDLRTAYQDIANAMAPLPYDAPKVVDTPSGDVPDSKTPPPGKTVPPTEYRHTTHLDGAPPSGTPPMWTAVVGPPPGLVRPDRSSGHVLGRDETRSDRKEMVGGPGKNGSFESEPHERGRVAPTPPVAEVDVLVSTGDVVSPAVLGRTETVPAAGPSTKSPNKTKAPGKERKLVKEVGGTHPEQRPDKRLVTESSATALVAGAPGTEAIVVRTTSDTPASGGAEPLSRISQGEPMVAVATAQSTPAEPPVPPKDPDPTVERNTATTTPGSGAVRHSAALQMNPADRGMFVPNTGTPPGTAQPPVEVPPNPAPQGHTGRGAQTDPYASQMGGYPMSPMMLGGTGGGGMPQQGSRVTAVPNEPRPEAWDPQDAGPGALGRREPEVRQSEPRLSRADLQAQLTEKLAELDRLMERGR
ncbi:hypothetical protein ALI144C_07840 [Actinosynnema sp. ALI-1.44]|uniref:WXG100 family type VII secretion target n=1 Tax=Actinosynnema sp. ALI-1.44 TaxID=1933779 RepID=UPI00097BB56F|nr:WXG100 family type VII secretion target [Actinosynnema sp. ALI-1.44]ONI87845.1 hypothetical protein ALI144C_07840 [Actinosynnema sp. ALI-1.44]